MKVKFFLSLFYLLIIHPAYCMDENTIRFTKEVFRIQSIQYFTDSSNQLSFPEAVSSGLFKESPNPVPNLNVSPYTHWIKFELYNATDLENFFLEIENPMIDVANLYFFHGEEEYKKMENGASIKISERTYRYPNPVFEIKIPTGEKRTFYLKIKSGNLAIVPLIITSTEVFFEQHTLKKTILGIYSGIIIAMFLYNLFLYFTVRDRNYLYYVAYIVFVGFTQLVLQGFTYKYLWPSSPWFANQSIVLFASLAGIAIALFVRNFLQVKDYSPFLNKGLNLIILLYIVAIPLRLAGFDNQSYQLVDLLAGVICFYALIIAIYITSKGNRSAKFFLIAWSVFLVGVIVYVLRNFGILPYNVATNYTMPFGNAIEVVLLSFALADRINILKKEKDAFQAEAIQALQENERLVKEQNIVLETEVRKRTLELWKSNNDLNSAIKNLRDTQSQLVNAEKMASLGQLTAGIAHEINNPINFVTSSVKPLKRDISDLLLVLNKYDELRSATDKEEKLNEIEKVKKEIDLEYVKEEIDLMLKGISEGASRTAEIVRGLRNFSRLDENDLKEVDINSGIESTLLLLNSSINGKVKVIRELGNIPPIECYPGKLNQVFMNLLNNAIHAVVKYRKPEEGEIIVRTWEEEKVVKISIKDNGTGIPPHLIEKIFDPFFTTKGVGEGTGLGLSIVYSIIEGHQGEIDVFSKEGAGTEFLISLPKSQKD